VLIISPLIASVAAAALATAPLQSDQGDQQASDRVLDEVTTTGQQFELGAQTGELLIRPVMYTSGNRQGSIVRQVDMFISPVEEVSNGEARLYTEQQRTRYRISMNVPVVNPTGTRFKLRTNGKIDLGTRRLDLPAGSYVISEIRYSIADRFGDGRGFFIPTHTTRSYCLTEETYIFDIENGETQFFGALALTALPTNSARWGAHYPVVGVDQRLDLISGREQENKDAIAEMDFDLVSVAAEKGLCANNNYQVSALAP